MSAHVVEAALRDSADWTVTSVARRAVAEAERELAARLEAGPRR